VDSSREAVEDEGPLEGLLDWPFAAGLGKAATILARQVSKIFAAFMVIRETFVRKRVSEREGVCQSAINERITIIERK
jgi:hypothetical protein